MMAQVRLATELDQIERCAPVMRELRTSLTESKIVERIQEQQYEGYRLAFVETEDAVVAVAGYRVIEHLAYGRFLYVDDLVTRAKFKRNGFAGSVVRLGAGRGAQRTLCCSCARFGRTTI